MKDRQRMQKNITIIGPQMEHRILHIEVQRPVRVHDPFWLARRATGVEDRGEIGFCDFVYARLCALWGEQV
jgi:hypothetical protein